ncbi:hypothetical protein MYP_4720 [Sporocytophaga myxococcoides]|uniref:Uncharacterized protein n=1 Tax=Sporocytophaga myxococcoides TaxID=153721 RepID=A0A098LKJ8_9BACT|nr:hypothetical protein [Sporocytophaga myxococcoides]GAL87490.1 hypothetical protein MYP_4720 [Sporocytophaga myxococcoides]
MKYFFTKAGYFLPILFLSLIHCKTKNEDHVNPSKANGSGEIIYQSSYKPSSDGVTLAKVISGSDTIYYFGSTNENGKMKSVNGYFLYNPITKITSKIAVDKTTNTISISESADDNSLQKVYLELKPLDDTLVEATAYEILHQTSERKILFQYLRKKEPSSQKIARSEEDDELVKEIQDLQIAAMNSTHQYGIVGMLSELDKSIKNGSIKTNLGPEIEGMLSRIKSASATEESYWDKLSAFIKNLRSDLKDKLTPDIYKAWKILDKYELYSTSGDNQTIVFGKSLKEPLVGAIQFDGEPAANVTVVIKLEAGSVVKEIITTSDEFGQITFENLSTKISDEDSGIDHIDVTFYKGGLLNKKTTFTINLKKRPRLSLIKFEETDNQTGEIKQFLKKPLGVMITVDDGTYGVGYTVKWSDPIGNGFSFPSSSITDITGITKNNLIVADHEPYKVTAEIVKSDEYVVLNNVEFTIFPNPCPDFAEMKGEWTMNFGTSSLEKYHMTFYDDHSGIIHSGVDGSGTPYENKECSPTYHFTWTIQKGGHCYLLLNLPNRGWQIYADYESKGNLKFTNSFNTCYSCTPPPNCP